MAKSPTAKRKTVDNDDLTIVVTKTVFGLASRYALVQNYGAKDARTLLKSDNNPDHFKLYTEALALSTKLNVALWEEK